MMVRMVAGFALAQIRSYLREPLALAWTVLFPVLLLLILGAVHRGPGPGSSRTMPLGDGHGPMFLLMGIIGMNVISVSLFGLGLVLVQLRALGVFRRLAMTPQPPWVFVVGQAGATSVVVLGTTAILLVAGGLAFDVPLPARLPAWAGCLTLGTGVFLGVGFALAATVREVRTAQALGNLAFIVLVVLGGVWYPVDGLPAPLRRISLALPLSHLLRSLRQTAAHGGQPLDLAWSIAVLAAWCLGAAVLAVSRFRWNDPR